MDVAKSADSLATASDPALADGTSATAPRKPGALAGGRVCPICDETYPPDFRVCPRDAARLESQEPTDDDPLLGSVLGGSFRISRVLGEGASAKVYEATHLRLGTKRFAVKVLRRFYMSNATAVARFQREAEAAAAIEHPGVVGVYDMNRTEDGRLFIVTELLSGADLGSLLEKEGRLSAAAAAGIARQVCQALAAAHARGIVHRDVKPGNVFVTGPRDAPRVKVLDFGISKVHDGAGLTRTGVIVGTPAYMSPEQASGGGIDARTDVYAVGALLYRALTGRVPFEGDDPSELLGKLLAEEPARPRSIEPGIPEALEVVVQRAMAKAAEDRYPTIAELERALAPFEDHASSEAEPSPEAAAEPAITARDIRFARPRLALLSLLCALWATGAVDAALLSVLAARDASGSGPHAGRALAVVVATLAVLAGPIALWLRYLRRVWPSTPIVVRLSRDLLRMLLAALCTYAALALLVRLSASTVAATPRELGAFVDKALGPISLLAAAAAWLSSRRLAALATWLTSMRGTTR